MPFIKVLFQNQNNLKSRYIRNAQTEKSIRNDKNLFEKKYLKALFLKMLGAGLVWVQWVQLSLWILKPYIQMNPWILGKTYQDS